MTFDVITFGSATLDIFADTYDRKALKKDASAKRYAHIIQYKVGDKILIRNLDISVGGGGTNTAVTFSRFGLKTAFYGSLGNDSTAEIVRNSLDKEGIAFIGTTVSQKTGLSIVLDSIEHDRTILAYKGANNYLKEKLSSDMASVKLFYFSSLLEESFETHKKILHFAQKHGIKVAFNPSSYQVKQGLRPLKDVLSKTNFLILNKEEAQDLLQNQTPQIPDLLNQLYKTLSSSLAVVVITDGKYGAYSFDGKDMLHVHPNPITVVESTGAGDAFASGFMGSLLYGKSVSEALGFGLANSESVITNPGAKGKILTYKEAEKKAKRVKITTLS